MHGTGQPLNGSRRPTELCSAKTLSPHLSGSRVAWPSHSNATFCLLVTSEQPLSACTPRLPPCHACHAQDSPDHYLALAYSVAKCGFAMVQSSPRRLPPTDDGLAGCNMNLHLAPTASPLRGHCGLEDAELHPGPLAGHLSADLASQHQERLCQSSHRHSFRKCQDVARPLRTCCTCTCRVDPHGRQRSASGSYRRLLHASNQFCDLS